MRLWPTLKNNQAGYSLVEILVAIQIFMLVITIGYTIYLYSIKFMDKWQQNNDLVASQLVLQRALDAKFNATKKIISISSNKIVLDNDQNIFWKADSFFINNKSLLQNDFKINCLSLEYFIRDNEEIKSVTFANLDKNSNSLLTSDELKSLQAIQLNLEIKNKKKKTIFNYFKSFKFPPF